MSATKDISALLHALPHDEWLQTALKAVITIARCNNTSDRVIAFARSNGYDLTV